MGMFDYIRCRVPLPGAPPSFVKPGHAFQTKDLSCTMDEYQIAADGVIDFMKEFTGTVDFYDSNIAGGAGTAVYTQNGEDSESVDYQATFVSGKLTGIVETDRTRRPALPIKRMHPYPPPTEEDKARWKARREESLVGRTVYVLWGGQRKGYAAELVAEDSQQWVAKSASGLELLHRFGRDSTIFDNEQDAMAERGENQADKDRRQKEYDDYAAEWRNRQGIAHNTEDQAHAKP